MKVDCGPLVCDTKADYSPIVKRRMVTSITTDPFQLPVAGTPRERADAVRNRAAIMCAAARLCEEQGVDAVSMDAIAAAAGVGKGTLFRRFGDRAGLLRALIEETEIRFQDELIRGLPPLGPGAPAADRLRAFGDAYVDFIHDHLALLVSMEATVRLSQTAGPYGFYRMHLAMLLREAVPDLDPEYHADVLLAALSPKLAAYHESLGWSRERSRDGFRGLLERLVS